MLSVVCSEYRVLNISDIITSSKLKTYLRPFVSVSAAKKLVFMKHSVDGSVPLLMMIHSRDVQY